jgi:hypothetical protein
MNNKDGIRTKAIRKNDFLLTIRQTPKHSCQVSFNRLKKFINMILG